MLKQFLQELGVSIAALVAGGAGGALSLLFGELKSRRDAFLKLLSGVFCAGYLTPLFAHWMDIGESLQNALAFGVGLSGVYIVSGIQTLASRWAKNPSIPNTPLTPPKDE